MDRYKKQRTRMVETQIKARDINDVRVLRAMGAIPRHLFVDEGLIDQAYNDSPLPIDEHQTISQPYIVALMTQASGVKGKGKGSGNRHRFRLSNGDFGFSGRSCFFR